MRERITFVHEVGEAVDPTTLIINDAGVSGPGRRCVREERLSFKVEELPPEIKSVLDSFQTLRVHWSSPLMRLSLEPFSSTVSPGLHVSYTLVEETEHDPSKLCWWLRKFGPLNCDSEKGFVRHGSKAQPLDHSFRLYHQTEDLHDFIEFSRWNLCEKGDAICHGRHRELYTASNLEVTYDAKGGDFKMIAFWPLRTHTIIAPASSKRRVEIGILGRDAPPNLEAHQIGLSGSLIVLGSQTEPGPTIFSVPSRHREGAAKFGVRFGQPTGLHPTMQLDIESNKAPAAPDCKPYAYLTLPKTIFIDRYQLADSLFLKSKNLTALQYTTAPVDLEAPAYTTQTWGSSALVELRPPSSDKLLPWTAEIPMHLRYLKPAPAGEITVEVPYPVVFWACPSSESLQTGVNPFDRTGLGYDDLFDPTTAFWHLTPYPTAGDRLLNTITVPVLKSGGMSWIETGTAAAVVAGFMWVLLKLTLTFFRSNSTEKPNSLPEQADSKKTR